MPDTTVRESRERIKSALMDSGFGYPVDALHRLVSFGAAPSTVLPHLAASILLAALAA